MFHLQSDCLGKRLQILVSRISISCPKYFGTGRSKNLVTVQWVDRQNRYPKLTYAEVTTFYTYPEQTRF